MIGEHTVGYSLQYTDLPHTKSQSHGAETHGGNISPALALAVSTFAVCLFVYKTKIIQPH